MYSYVRKQSNEEVPVAVRAADDNPALATNTHLKSTTAGSSFRGTVSAFTSTSAFWQNCWGMTLLHSRSGTGITSRRNLLREIFCQNFMDILKHLTEPPTILCTIPTSSHAQGHLGLSIFTIPLTSAQTRRPNFRDLRMSISFTLKWWPPWCHHLCFLDCHAYRFGDFEAVDPGTLENKPHGSVHIWTNLKQMATFQDSAQDPMIFTHHANIDQLWRVEKNWPGGHRQDLTDSNYLNTDFTFYD